jgi:hypothetical protein
VWTFSSGGRLARPVYEKYLRSIGWTFVPTMKFELVVPALSSFMSVGMHAQYRNHIAKANDGTDNQDLLGHSERAG